MKSKVDMGARILLGLIMVVFGLNFFLQFIPMPAPSEEMGKVFGGFMATGYLLQLVKVIEIVTGALLIANLFVPLSIVLLGPIVVNILGIHIFVDKSGLPMAIALVALFTAIIWARWDKLSWLFKAK